MWSGRIFNMDFPKRSCTSITLKSLMRWPACILRHYIIYIARGRLQVETERAPGLFEINSGRGRYETEAKGSVW